MLIKKPTYTRLYRWRWWNPEIFDIDNTKHQRFVDADLKDAFKLCLVQCKFCEKVIYPESYYGVAVFGKYIYTTNYFCSESCAEEYEELN